MNLTLAEVLEVVCAKSTPQYVERAIRLVAVTIAEQGGERHGTT